MSDWQDLLKSIPGAAKAVTQMVQEVGNLGTATLSIGTAKASQVAQAIKDDTALRSASTKALADAVRAHVASNPELGERALQHVAAKLVREQANREVVTVQALEDLRDNPPEKVSTETPSDDWLNMFEGYAEKASTDKMRAHWAQILSGEIRKPGTFSMVTLQMASILDQQLAQTIERVAPWIINESFVPMTNSTVGGIIYGDLVTLNAIGFLRLSTGDSMTFSLPEGKASGTLTFRAKKSALTTPIEAGKPVNVPVSVLTRSGRELLQIMSWEEHPDLIPELKTLLEAEGCKPELKTLETTKAQGAASPATI